jgi:hypothetical protein
MEVAAMIPSDRQWQSLIEEAESLLADLRSLSGVARWRARQPIRDGYPTQSMPESSIASGRMGDPTLRHVEVMAGGRSVADGDRENSDDHWKGPKDPVALSARHMEDRALKAVESLRGAVGAARDAVPKTLPEKGRECCSTCGVPKFIVTNYGEKPKAWATEEGKCRTCADRIKRHAAPKGIPSHRESPRSHAEFGR